MHWLSHVLGIDDVAGRWYAWWSGAGSDIGEAGIIVGLAALVRKHNCHVKRCPRIGRHPVAGTAFVVCGHHHPDGPPGAEHVRRAYLGRRPGRG